MKNYGGWRDEYNYIFATKPYADNQSQLNKYTTFKVIDEKTQTSVLNSTHKICIIEDIKNKTLKASIYCKDIPHINEVTKILTELLKEIEAKGKAYVATTNDLRDSKIKPVLKINNFMVFEMHNAEELKTLITSNNGQDTSYEYIMSGHLIPLKENEVFDENAQSKIFLHYFGGGGNHERYGYSSFESYIQNNRTTSEMEKWIMDNHSHPRDRWAIRSILSVVQQALAVEDKMKHDDATEFVKGLEASKACVTKYYSSPEKAKGDIDKALDKFFDKGDRRAAFNRIKDAFDSKYGSTSEPCYNFFPPVVCGGEEKCESWTR